MKNYFKILFVLIFAILLSCEKNNPVVNEDVQFTDCKIRREGDSLEYFICEAIEDNYLKISHVNAEFDYLPKNITVNIDVKRKNIDIYEEIELDNSDNCFCPIDITYEIGELKKRKYKINIFLSGVQYAHFFIDYNSALADTILKN